MLNILAYEGEHNLKMMIAYAYKTNVQSKKNNQ